MFVDGSAPFSDFAGDNYHLSELADRRPSQKLRLLRKVLVSAAAWRPIQITRPGRAGAASSFANEDW